jgi:hypothetical protein
VGDRFEELVRQGRNADVMTLQGEVCLEEGLEEKALGYFRRAIAIGTGEDASASGEDDQRQTGQQNAEMQEAGVVVPKQDSRPPRWAWEASCMLKMGSILGRQGNMTAAERAYRTAALQLDNREGYLRLGKALPSTDGKHKEAFLAKAAVSGSREASDLLASSVKDRVAGAVKSSRQTAWDLRFESLMIQEWSNLAKP